MYFEPLGFLQDIGRSNSDCLRKAVDLATGLLQRSGTAPVTNHSQGQFSITDKAAGQHVDGKVIEGIGYNRRRGPQHRGLHLRPHM